ncbi:MAG: hypothetical protein ACKOKF_09395 [Bacteroidota bacterium]
MSEETNNQQRGGNRKGPGAPKFRFNFYWIYGIFIVGLLFTTFFKWGGGEVNTDFQNVRQMLLDKDVDRIQVDEAERTAHIYIKKDKLKEEKYKNVRLKTWGDVENTGPHYYILTGPPESFVRKIEEAQAPLAENERIEPAFIKSYSS